MTKETTFAPFQRIRVKATLFVLLLLVATTLGLYIIAARIMSQHILSEMIMRAEAGSSTYQCVLRVDKGSRPLNLCHGKNGEIYWGEYFLNLRRSEPVRIFGSTNKGKTERSTGASIF